MQMPVTAVVGAQWGDEGKGRIVDYLAQKVGAVVRYQGGDNAGHTVMNEYGRFQLHLLPSGIFNPNTHCIIGAGTVVNLAALIEEIDRVETAGVMTNNLWLDERAHVLLPDYRQLDALQEQARGNHAIGTTKRGIGPAYTYKVARAGLRMGDLKHPDWALQRLRVVRERLQAEFATFGAELPPLEEMVAQLTTMFAQIEKHVVDTVPILRKLLQAGAVVISEGQLGVMRDLDWGIYPYVTSSNPLASYAAIGAGFPASYITRVVGVAKCYTTAVGAGPFPAELTGKTGEQLRQIGREYGATTGRPRRTGWFDAVAARYAAWISGMTELALTKLDVLDQLPKIGICVGYKLPDGRTTEEMVDTYTLEQVEPIWEYWPGWLTDTSTITTCAALPENARNFLHRVEELVGVHLSIVSVGPERNQLILMETNT